jgi:3-isopropylmalate dehydratase small subunit
MEPVRLIRSRTVVLPEADIDTDQIFPARFLTTTSGGGFADMLFADWRFDAAGQPRPQFPLNRPEAAGCQVLVAGPNFGCGSSREHAPWALLDQGLSCVIAPSFADIFYNNCFKNGLLPIVLPREVVDQLMEQAGGPNHIFNIDLAAQTVTAPDGKVHRFDIDQGRKASLLAGLDEVGETLTHSGAIRDFEERRKLAQPWLA